MKFKHDALLRQWLDGDAVQFKSQDVWVDMPHPSEAHKAPSFYVDQEYRLKPVTIRYRLWVSRTSAPHLVTSMQMAELAERNPAFKRWLTEWSEVLA